MMLCRRGMMVVVVARKGEGVKRGKVDILDGRGAPTKN